MFNLFASFLIWAIRGWCTWRGRVRVIRRPPGPWASGVVVKRNGELLGQPYLIRYALFGWLPGDKRRASWLPNIYLHNILLPDADPAPHNHPWPWALSLILTGVYEEARTCRMYDCDEIDWKAYGPGDFNKIRANTFHRISNVVGTGGPGTPREHGCWTLFVTSGGKRQPWGFAVPGQGFVPHRERDLSASRRTLIPPALADEKVQVSL